MTDYTPPHNIEAERSVLGSIMLDPKMIYVAVEHLTPQDFYSQRNQLIYKTMCELSASGNPIDNVTVVEAIERVRKLDGDGTLYITDLAGSVPSASNVDYYIQIVREKSALRQIISAGNQMAREALNADSAEDIINTASDKLYQLSVSRNRDTLEPMSTLLVAGYKQITEKGATGMQTGFKTLDRKLTGLHKSELIVIAGRPGMGKTSLAMNIAQNISSQNIPVAVFSLEMEKVSLAVRMMCSEALVDGHRARGGQITNEEYERLASVMNALSRTPVYIDDTPTITVAEMSAKARKMKQQAGLGLVVIDYLQLMTGTGKRENRVQEISGITRALKIMAKELDVPVILLSQLSRETEKRESKRPLLSDLRESGSIEQDADVVLFIHRESYYKQTSDKSTDLIIAKQRSGPTGTIKIDWSGEYTRFAERDARTEDFEPTDERMPFND